MVAVTETQIPPRAAVLSMLVLAIPALGSLAIPEIVSELEVVLWLLPLVPAFLLAYYRGWTGIATALAMAMALLSLSHVIAAVLGRSLGGWPFLLAVTVVYVGVSLGFGFLSERMHRLQARIREMEMTDPETALPTMRTLEHVLEREFAAAQRGRPLTVVVFDVDPAGFRDGENGSNRGEQLATVFARVLRGHTRKMNLSACYEPGKFISVLSDADPEGTLVFIQKVRDGLRAGFAAAAPVPVIAGVARYHETMRSPTDLLQAARHALHRAKWPGNHERVSVFDRSGPALAADVQERSERIREYLRRAAERRRGALDLEGVREA